MQVTQLLTVAVVGATIGGEESVGPGFQPRHDDCDGCPGAVVVMLLGLLSTVDGREVGAGGGVEVLGPPVVVLFLNSLPRLEECPCSFVVLGVVGQRRGCLKRRIWAGDEKLALFPNSLPLRLEEFSCSFEDSFAGATAGVSRGGTERGGGRPWHSRCSILSELVAFETGGIFLQFRGLGCGWTEVGDSFEAVGNRGCGKEMGGWCQSGWNGDTKGPCRLQCHPSFA